MATTQSGVAIPTLSELLARIDEVRPVLERNADSTESERRIAQENIDALTAAGAFLVTVPRHFGGYEMTVAEKLEVSAAVAESCGSTGWVVALINVCNWMAGLLPAEGREEVLGGSRPPMVAGVLNPSDQVRAVGGGWIVSGRWPWASGSLHADWALVGALIPGADGTPPDQRLVFIPMSQLTIEDTWFVAGMKGTGSNTLVADEVFVPEHRSYSVAAALQGANVDAHDDEPLYRSSFIPLLTLILAGPQLGLGRAALRFVIEKAPRRGISYTTFARQTDSTAFQLQIAHASMLIDSAHLHSFRAAADIDDAAARAHPLSYLARTRVRADTAFAIGRIREAIDALLSAHGASSFATVSPLQRIWRDSATAGRHAVADPLVNQEVYGKALLGIPYEENITPLI